MSDKALAFEDFVLDDYDFNVYTDWDLMDLWEWVEMDDFSDLEGGGYGHNAAFHASADIHNSHADEIMDNMDAPPDNTMSQGHASDISDDLLSHATAPQNDFDQDFNFDDMGSDDDFDFDFNDDGDFETDFSASEAVASAPIATPSHPSHIEASPPSMNDSIDSNHTPNLTGSAPMNDTPQAPITNDPVTNDDDFDFDFGDDDDDFDFDFDDDTADDNQASSPSVSPESAAPQAVENNDDFDFDFSFDDDDGMDFQDFETSDSLDLDMTTETDNLSEADYDFNLQQDDGGFGAGGYAADAPPSQPENAPALASAPPEPPAAPAAPSLDTLTEDGHPRYIETSAGVMDIETDHILSFLQQLEFDEFLETLQLNGHVYDRIMASDEWSQEEIEFLRSIEPLVKDEEKIAQIRAQKEKEAEEAKHRMPETSGYEGKDPSTYDPRTCSSIQEVQRLLKEKSLDSNLGQKRAITHMPKKLVAEWSKDTYRKKSTRVGKNFNKKLKPASEKNHKPWLKHVPDLPTIKTGKNERYYNELHSMVSSELHAMCGNLDPDSINFIKEDGERFGNQFTEFLLGKYGTKILFLYRSQMGDDILADKMFEDFYDLFMSNLSPSQAEDYTQDFFRAILSQMNLHNINI